MVAMSSIFLVELHTLANNVFRRTVDNRTWKELRAKYKEVIIKKYLAITEKVSMTKESQ